MDGVAQRRVDQRGPLGMIGNGREQAESAQTVIRQEEAAAPSSCHISRQNKESSQKRGIG